MKNEHGNGVQSLFVKPMELEGMAGALGYAWGGLLTRSEVH